MKKILAIVAVVLVVGAAIIGLGVWFLVKAAVGLNDVAHDHLDLIKSGDIEAAYEMTSADFKEATSLKEYKGFIEDTTILTSFTDASLNSVSAENGVLTITGSLSDDDGTMPIQFIATKVGEGDDESWEIVSIELNPAGFDTGEDDDTDFMIDDY